jgi:hypothetical protein
MLTIQSPGYNEEGPQARGLPLHGGTRKGASQ